MSHSNMFVRYPDGAVRHGEYNGTGDFLMPQVFDTEEEMLAAWRDHDWSLQPDPDRVVPVEIWITYGGWLIHGEGDETCLVTQTWDEFYDEAREETPRPEWATFDD